MTYLYNTRFFKIDLVTLDLLVKTEKEEDRAKLAREVEKQEINPNDG